MKAGSQVFQPRFTSHGYQYVEITGIDKPLPLDGRSGRGDQFRAGVDRRLQDLQRKGQPAVVESGLVQRGQLPHDPDRLPAAQRAHGLVGRHQCLLAHRDLCIERRPVPDPSHVRDARRAGRLAGGSRTSRRSAAASAASSGEARASSFRGRPICNTGTSACWSGTTRRWSPIWTISRPTIDPKTGLSSDAQLGDWLGPQNNALGSALPGHRLSRLRPRTSWRRSPTSWAKPAMRQSTGALYEKRKAFFNADVRECRKEDARHRPADAAGSAAGGRRAPPPEFKVADTQTSYAVGLGMGLFSERERARHGQEPGGNRGARKQGRRRDRCARSTR